MSPTASTLQREAADLIRQLVIVDREDARAPLRRRVGRASGGAAGADAGRRTASAAIAVTTATRPIIKLLSSVRTAMAQTLSDPERLRQGRVSPWTTRTAQRRGSLQGGRRDSNPRPPGSQPGALPAELRPPRRTRQASRRSAGARAAAGAAAASRGETVDERVVGDGLQRRVGLGDDRDGHPGPSSPSARGPSVLQIRAGGALGRRSVAAAEEDGVHEQRQQLVERDALLVAVGAAARPPRRRRGRPGRASRTARASRGRSRGGRRRRRGRSATARRRAGHDVAAPEVAVQPRGRLRAGRTDRQRR